MTNVIFSGNSSYRNGGAMYNWGAFGTNSPIMANVTFSGNYSTHGVGGAIYIYCWQGTCQSHIRNSILWNNQDRDGSDIKEATIYNDSATITLTHSIVQNFFPGGSLSKISWFLPGSNRKFASFFVTPSA